MQKNKLWLIIALVVIAVAAFIFWLAPKASQNDPSDQSIQQQNTPLTQGESATAQATSGSSLLSPSQQDTEVNCQISMDGSNRLIVNEQTRNCFEYFITQYGEKSIDQIKKDFKAYIAQGHKEPALSQIYDLWDRYMKYREQLGNLQPPSDDKESPQYYRSIYSSTQNLRKQFFSDYEIEGLFGKENTYHEYTLKRMEVVNDKKLSESEKAKKLKALFDELPEDWKENLEQINKLEDLRKLTADIKARGGSSEEIHQMRLNLVGPEATQRLENLDTQRSSWKSSVNQYLTERDSIVKSNMSDSAKQQAVQQLRNQHFKSKEDQLRVSTFESVHDQGGKLPFAE
ncbi:lipase secretion chaperone [Acinetobacter sp. ANC 4945]|uniref:Lipase chaperone n=1 Tax=Acinetobacter amyesii TaxID=2942470 RepID=A0A1T1H4X7_9GAMM|nr:lipase secretion chaperone [Acinetobacter amyesii]MCL6246956.1 lipase secretion chaperone [Acinetobacter amyesii]OOV84845.1 lipase chaperone [Acinetobacter amyesii]